MSDNPPAFPRDHRYQGHNGMTLRDWFAGQALGGYLAAAGYQQHVAESYNIIAKSSYRFADAMLAAGGYKQ